MEKQYCRNCKYYRQHYALDQRKIFRVYCGHCTAYPRKKKRPDAAACAQFISAPQDENAFATKEYLSKELLQYVLQLELLPKIEPEENNAAKIFPITEK